MSMEFSAVPRRLAATRGSTSSTSLSLACGKLRWATRRSSYLGSKTESKTARTRERSSLARPNNVPSVNYFTGHSGRPSSVRFHLHGHAEGRHSSNGQRHRDIPNSNGATHNEKENDGGGEQSGEHYPPEREHSCPIGTVAPRLQVIEMTEAEDPTVV